MKEIVVEMEEPLGPLYVGISVLYTGKRVCDAL